MLIGTKVKFHYNHLGKDWVVDAIVSHDWGNDVLALAPVFVDEHVPEFSSLQYQVNKAPDGQKPPSGTWTEK